MSGLNANANLDGNVEANDDDNLNVSKYTYDVANIKEIIGYYHVKGQISDRDFRLLINEIEILCRRTRPTRNITIGQNYIFAFKDIPNIIMAGWQQHDKIEVQEEKKEKLKQFAKNILQLIDYTSDSSYFNIVDSYRKFEIDDNEFKYIIVKVLDEILKELIDIQNLLLDNDLFNNAENRFELATDYYKKLRDYLALRKYYESLNDYSEEMETETGNALLQTDIVGQKKRRLIYAQHPSNCDKTMLLSDMGPNSNVREEWYFELIKLLEDFKVGNRDRNIIKPLEKKAKHTQLSYVTIS